MTNSMTGYAQAAINLDIGELSCEFRTVNHRYLDIAPRMPEELRVYESEIREAITAKVTRGRIDCFIRLKENENTALVPNAETAANLQSLLSEMQKQVPNMQPIRAIDVLRWPGVLQARKIQPEELKSSLMSIIDQALDDLQIARAQEGSKISDLITERLDGISAVLAEVDIFMPEIAVNYRARLEEKLAELGDKLDPSRLEQEMILFLQKADVAEEVDRLHVHIEEVAAVLAKAEPTGRKLDFLMQELNREANTLGSKAQDARLTKAAVELKVLIEQMREQVQNLE